MYGANVAYAHTGTQGTRRFIKKYPVFPVSPREKNMAARFVSQSGRKCQPVFSGMNRPMPAGLRRKAHGFFDGCRLCRYRGGQEVRSADLRASGNCGHMDCSIPSTVTTWALTACRVCYFNTARHSGILSQNQRFHLLFGFFQQTFGFQASLVCVFNETANSLLQSLIGLPHCVVLNEFSSQFNLS